jgi:hypothetical protein
MAIRRANRDEIVEEIVDHLRSWTGRKDNAAITAEVNRELDLLLIWPPQATLRSYQKEERTHARRLQSALNPLIKSHQVNIIYQAHFDISSVRSEIEPERKLENVETETEAE